MFLIKKIKVFLALINLLLVSQLAYSQSNLQFNRAFIETVTLTTGGLQTKTLMVPAGKVWKIEQASVLNDDSTPTDISFNYVSVSGTTLAIDAFGLLPVVTTGSTAPASPRLPLWLPEGTYTLKFLNNGSLFPLTGAINGIEFNLVP